MNNELGKIRAKVMAGHRLTEGDAVSLFETDDIFTLGELASHAARAKNGSKAYFIRNIHVNPTNICINRCRFCAFSRSKGQDGAYELSIKDIIGAIKRAWPVSEVHIVGGLHPEWPFEHYLRIVKAIKKSFPSLHVKAFTATEIDYMAGISGLSIPETLKRLRASGLDSMPGGGAEIFDRRIRGRLCPEKLSGEKWLEVMETAHKAGIKSNATMLYGHIEGYAHRVKHMLRLRELQDRSLRMGGEGGFQAFIPLRYHSENTMLEDYKRGLCAGLDDIKTMAVSRLVLDNFPHIKAYWVMLGEKVSQLALLFGADDLDGTVIEEKITRSAGGERSSITAEELRHLIKRAGLRPVERDSFYRPLT